MIIRKSITLSVYLLDPAQLQMGILRTLYTRKQAKGHRDRDRHHRHPPPTSRGSSLSNQERPFSA